MNIFLFNSDYLPLILYSLWWLLIFCFYLLKKEKSLKFLKFSLLVFLLVTLLGLASQALEIYLSYHNSSLKFLLPSHSDFYWTKVTQLIVSANISAVLALIFSFFIFLFIKKTRQEILDAFDGFLISFSLLVLGWPNFLLFLFILILLTVLGSIVSVIAKKKSINERFVITPYIPLAFLLVLWFGSSLATITTLYKIRF